MIFMNPSEYRIGHSYMPTIIVPYVAISNNWEFLVNQDVKDVITSDNKHCEVLSKHIYNICDLEKDIQNIYKISAWDFLKKWYAYDKDLTTMNFIKIELKLKQ